MAKQGQHHNDTNDQNLARSRNNPAKSVPMTTDTPKKRETYKKQAALHQDPGKRPPVAKPMQHADTRDLLMHEADSRARARDRAPRSGSDSDASPGSRGH